MLHLALNLWRTLRRPRGGVRLITITLTTPGTYTHTLPSSITGDVTATLIGRGGYGYSYANGGGGGGSGACLVVSFTPNMSAPEIICTVPNGDGTGRGEATIEHNAVSAAAEPGEPGGAGSGGAGGVNEELNPYFTVIADRPGSQGGNGHEGGETYFGGGGAGAPGPDGGGGNGGNGNVGTDGGLGGAGGAGGGGAGGKGASTFTPSDAVAGQTPGGGGGGGAGVRLGANGGHGAVTLQYLALAAGATQ